MMLITTFPGILGCDNNIADPLSDDGGRGPDHRRLGPSDASVYPTSDTSDLISRPDRTASPLDSRILPNIDLPTRVGDPCYYGKCASNLICMANTCMNMCSLPPNDCNEVSPACGANEWCAWASNFTGACLPGRAQYKKSCDSTKGLFCVQGTLCVKVNKQAPKCLKLCKYGCPNGVHCNTLSNGCQACIE